VLPLTRTPLVLVVAACWLVLLVLLPVVAPPPDKALALDSADTLDGLGGALLLPFWLLSTASALDDAALTADGWW
jgi:hypothetical protein